jgi:NDP-mannose synthase
MKAVILAGGKGTRLAPYTKVLPKPLLPIGDMPILEILLRQLKRAGVEEAVLTVGHMAQLLRLFFQDGESLGMKISYSYEDTPLGTAGPLAQVDGLTESFIVANGDVLTTLNFKDMVQAHRESGAIATIATHKRSAQIDLGVIEFKDDCVIGNYIEKPTRDYYVSMGIYIFDPRAIQYIPRKSYYDFPDLVIKMLQSGEKICGYKYDGYWQDLGRHDDYEQAIDEFDKLRHEILGE